MGWFRKINITYEKENCCNFINFASDIFFTFSEEQICYALRSKLTWTHYRLIMRVDNPNARQYYINECAEQMWSSRVLERKKQLLRLL